MTSFKLNDGHEIPALGLGTWRTTPDDVAASAVESAIKSGYRHIDTAKAYGNEAGVGRGINAAIQAGVAKREELFVVTKLWSDDHAADRVVEGCKTALSKLGLSYLDLFLVHWPCTDQPGEQLTPPYKETWQAMEGLVDAGLVRSIGVSNMTAKKLRDLLGYARIKPAVNQIEIHPGWRHETTIKFCQENGIHCTAYSPLGSIGASSESGLPLVVEDPAVKKVAEETGRTPALVLLRWLLQNGHSFLPKSKSPEHIKANLGVYEFELSDAQMQALSSLQTQKRTCTGDMFLNEKGPYRTLDELWDGEGY